MKKRMMSLVLILCMISGLLSSIPITAFAATYGLLTYEKIYGTITITDCDETATFIKIPDEIDGVPVTNIGNNAFEYCKNLTSIEIPDGVTSIGTGAFDTCYSLISITIPDRVTSIGDGVFASCLSLENVKIGTGVMNISEDAFVDCYCLKNINVESNNQYYTSIDGVLFNKNKTKLIKYPEGKENTEYKVPDGVKIIGDTALYSCKKLTRIDIPDGVTSIDVGAFMFCENLTSINIPNSLTSIGDKAFMYCEKLTGIKIPNNLIIIGKNAFNNCYHLENIIIPNSVTSIGSGAFYRCTSLKSMVLSNNITSIEKSTFAYCYDLISIKFSDAVTHIGKSAFDCCYDLSDVYYSGSGVDWAKISISSYNEELTGANIHYNAFRPAAPGYHEPNQKSGTFQFASEYGNQKGENDNSLASYVYDDNYFAETAVNHYNHDLAKMSLRFAMSAFAVHGSGTDKYKNQAVNAEALLTELGFNELDNLGYTEQPSTNSIGVIAGNKKIAFEDDDYTLIAVAIRGGGYESEWGGNFNVGSGENHQGFQMARDKVLTFLTEYVQDAEISGNIKIWITGFSRAAATANLTAAYLNTHSLILNGTNTDPDKIIQVMPENIYAYCFETPAGTRDTDRNDAKYNNIFSIVNQNDFVPMVAPEDWGYGRYGITYYLPSPKTHSNFRDLEIKMYSYYDEYVEREEKSWRSRTIGDFDAYKLSWSLEEAYPYYGFYLKNLNSNQSLDEYLIKTIGDLTAEFPSAANYEETLQDALIYVGTTIMGKGNTTEIIETFKQEFISRLNPLKIGFETIDSLSRKQQIGLLDASIRATFRELGISTPDETVDKLDDLLYVLLKTGKLETLLGNLDILPKVHYPELCMAWLDSKTDVTEYVSETRKVCLNCPVDFEVYNSNNNLVAAVYDNVPQEITGSSIVAYLDENGQKVVYLPSDEEYQIEVIATDDGEVSYSVQEQNGTTGEVRLVNYNKMSVSKNDTLTGVAENLETVETATYALTSNTITVDEPDIVENAAPVKVAAETEGNGNVTGGGNLYPGEYAQLTATPYEKESFLGWYNGETMVSTDSTYRFQVTGAITLTAKFTENTCEILYLTAEEEVVAIDRILKGSAVTFPAMNQNPSYIILGFYTDPECTIEAKEEATYSAGTILYIDCVHQDDWLQLDTTNNEVIIYSPETMTNVRLMVALYQEGRLLGLQPETVSLTMGKNLIDSPFLDYGTADEVKLFVWEDESNIKPLFRASKAGI